LRAGRLTESQDSLRKADRVDPIPPDIAAGTRYNETPTVEQLKTALDRLKPN
jgi:hypothetical protein